MKNNMIKKNLLLVEDEKIIASSEKIMLEKYNYNVQIAYSGEEAIEIIKTNDNIDLILMDIELGNNIDGTIAAKEILELKDIPIVFYSNNSDPEIVEKTEKITSYGYVLKGSNITVIDASIKMAFKLFNAKHESKETLNYYQAMLEATPDFIFIFDNNGIIIDYKGANSNKTLILPKKFLSSHFSEVFPEKLSELTQKHLKVAFDTFEIQKYEYVLKINDKLNYFQARLIAFGENHAILNITDITDLTVQKQKEKILKESEELFKSLFIESPASIIIHDKDTGEIIDANPTAYHKYGFEKVDDLIKHSKKIWFKPPYAFENALKKIQSTSNNSIIQFEWCNKDIHGNLFWEEVSLNTIILKGKKRVVAVSIDITERITAEKKIRKLLKEKELLLKETHHRIKNNMSAISNFLLIETLDQESEIVKNVLNDASNRIVSMMMLYDSLYKNKIRKKMNIKSFIENLIEKLTEIHNKIVSYNTKIHIEDIYLKSEICSSIGIIINELFTNSIKYAFKNKNKDNPLITISITKSNKIIKIVFADNGSGLPDSITLKNNDSFGLKLVNILVEQMSGKIKINRINGTKYLIKLKK